ncbi:DnaJ-domain-containing protein, partial [Coemansia reversa NRRL 1564]
TPFNLNEDDDIPDLYELLDVSRAAKDEELRKAYRKRALRTHPDKWAHLKADSDEAKAKTVEFQQVGFAYSILKDPKRRRVYDKTGRVDDILNVVEEGKDWDAYFRELWSGVVDASTIEQFAKTYKGSDEEKSDILAAYNTHKGDIDLIFTEVMLAEVDDEPRFIKVIEAAIKDKSLKRTKAYMRTKKDSEKRKRKAEEEATEAEELRKELGLDDQLRKIKGEQKKKTSGKRKHEIEDGSDDEALKTLIRQRTSSRMDAIIANIEEKYTSQKSSKKKSKKNRS